MLTNMRYLILSFITVLFLCGYSRLAGQDQPSPGTSDKETMLVVVADSLISNRAYHNAHDMYIRIKYNFTKAFEKEDWPVELKFERWSSSIPEDGLQLRVWFKSLEEETFSDLVFRAWVTLHENGEKTDFGIVKVSTYPRAGQNTQDTLDEIVLMAGEAVAKKLNEAKFKKQ